MSILLVPATLPYPPGITGDPYTPDDISKFYDLNWPPMYTGVKSTGFTSPGLLGLGQVANCTEYDENNNCVAYSTDYPATPIATPVITQPVSPATPSGSCVVGGIDPANGFQILSCSGGAITSELDYNSSSSLNTPLTPAQAGLTPAQQAALIAATGNSAVSLIRTAAGGPYTVAGTNMVYNPATGQLTTTAAVNATAGVNLSSISAYIPYIALAIGAIVLLPMLTGKK